MKGVGAAIGEGLRAPIRHVRLVTLLWLARLLPIVLAFGLPAFDRIAARSAHHPDAGLLLDPGADKGRFAWSWTRDLFRTEMSGTADTIFWLVFVAWVLVTFLAGGITARLVHGRGPAGLLLAECGRYAGRFLRLALVAAGLFYLVDVGLNSLLSDVHAERAKLHHTQDYFVTKSAQRGLIFLALLHVLGALHTYARIDIVAHERRSVFVALLYAGGTLLARFPKLVLVELAMLGLTGAAALVAWLLLRVVSPVDDTSGWVPIGIFLGLAAVASYLRTGMEVGTLAARCRLLAPPLPPTVSQKETLPSF